MAAILLDVDGVLHVSGQPLPGAADAVRRLREAGHRLRFVTNATTRSKAELAAGLQAMGIELEVGEVQTTADAAVEALRGRRVLALVMHALVGDLEGIELVGDNVDAVLIGGADDSPETNLVFSYMNLARAFAELEIGRRPLLPPPQSLVADRARAAARLRLLRRGARVRDSDGGDRARQAEPRRTSTPRAARSTPSPR